MGSLNNVGMSAIMRAFYVCCNCPATRNRKVPYPFVEVNGDILEYLSNVYLRLYKLTLVDSLIPIYVAGILQLCCYKKDVVKFKYPEPMEGIQWRIVYDNVFNVVKGSNIEVNDARYWTEGKNPQQNSKRRGDYKYTHRRQQFFSRRNGNNNNSNESSQDSAAATEQPNLAARNFPSL